MRERPATLSEAPPWVASLDTAVWITGPHRTIAWMNEKAADLLGVPISSSMGRPCHKVVGGRDTAGRPFCAPECLGSGRVRCGKRLAPFRLAISGPDGSSRWIRVLIIPVRYPDTGETCLVHCVVTSAREVRIERYLRSVANRWDGLPGRAAPAVVVLTEREDEIMDLLARDESLHSIAGTLNLSYATVRNHIQHILRKTGVHSIAEAVARRLLSGSEDGP